MIVGVGEGITFLCALLVSGQYFREKKALAIGLVACGAGIGSVVLPYIYRFLFDFYGFSGACLLLGKCI